MTLATSPRVRLGSSSVPRRRSRPGFSILELVVVLVLVGIVTAVSAGRLSSMRAEQRVVRAAGVIQSQLEKAFAIADRTHQPMHIVWTASSLQISVTNRAETMTYGQAKLGSDFGLKTGEVTATRASTEVYPNGFANDTLSITISTLRGGTTYTKRIRMSRAGLVQVI